MRLYTETLGDDDNKKLASLEIELFHASNVIAFGADVIGAVLTGLMRWYPQLPEHLQAHILLKAHIVGIEKLEFEQMCMKIRRRYNLDNWRELPIEHIDGDEELLQLKFINLESAIEFARSTGNLS